MSWTQLSAVAFLVLGLSIVTMTFEVWAAAFLGLLFAISLIGPAQWIRSRWPMPAWTSTVLVMLMVVLVLTGLGFVIGPPLVAQADLVVKELPGAMDKSLGWLDERKWGRNVVRQVELVSGMSVPHPMDEGKVNDGTIVPNEADRKDTAESPPAERDDDGSGDNADNARSIIPSILQTVVPMLSVTVWTVMLASVSLIIMVYVALNPDVYRRGILWMIPLEREANAHTTLTRMAVALRWWMLGRAASMLAIGVLTSLGMWIVGMPAPLALGALAGILSFVPNVGPITAAVPGLLLAVPEGPWMLLSALGVYIVAQMIDSNLISPLVDQYTVTLPSAVLIVAQLIMAVLGGAWGVLIATPLLVVVMVLTQQLYVREYLNKPVEVIGSNEDKSPDEAP